MSSASRPLPLVSSHPRHPRHPRRSRHLAGLAVAAMLALSSVTPALALDDTEAPVVQAPVLSATTAGSGAPVWLQAEITDGTDVASAEVSTDGGVTWQPLAATTAAAYGSTSVSVVGAVNAGVSQLAPGGYGSCVVFRDGTAACWGDNFSGQLGDGTRTTRYYPAPVQGLTGITALDAAEYVTCASLQDHTLDCWGTNSTGQLGYTADIGQALPTQVAPEVLTDVVAPETEGWTDCAVHADGGLSCWGYGGSGQFGDGTITDSHVPTRVPGLTGLRDVALGYTHDCVALANGDVDCWGESGDGQMPAPAEGTLVTVPTLLPGVHEVTAIDAGDYHTCAITSGGSLVCWGGNGSGQVGTGDTVNHPTPYTVPGLGTVTDMAIGGTHSCVLNAAGETWCWGDNTFGQLGNGTTDPSLTPVQVQGLDGVTVRTIASRGMQTCALTADATVLCWGEGGGVGAGSSAAHSLPTAPIGLYGPLTPAGHQVCVRATDSAGNTSDGTACAGLTVDPWAHHLGVTLTGPTLGYVAAYDAVDTRLVCPDTCDTDIAEGTELLVYANAFAGSTFAGWTGGPCAGTTTTPCTFTMDQPITLGAKFVANPVIGTPAVKARLGATLASPSSSSTIPVTVSWTATSSAPKASVLVERSVNGGPWTTVATPAATATSANAVAPSTGTVQFRVTLTDTEGGTATSTTASITGRLVQQTSTAVSWAGSWSTYRLASLSGGSDKYATAKGAAATYSGTFRSIAVVAPKGPGRGYVQIFIDGVSKAKVSLLRSSLQARVIIWQGAVPYGKHTIRIVNLATAGKPRVDVDAIVTFR